MMKNKKNASNRKYKHKVASFILNSPHYSEPVMSHTPNVRGTEKI